MPVFNSPCAVALLFLALALPIVAQDPSSRDPSSNGNWFQREFERFRSYPHLSSAYQLEKKGRLDQARKEFETYLAMRPKDDEARLAYLLLLFRMEKYDEVVPQADPRFFGPPMRNRARLYRGLARWHIRDGAGAIVDLQDAAADTGLRASERALALETAAAIGLNQGTYALVLETLGRIPGMERSCPLLVAKASALQRLGQPDQARRVLETALTAEQPCPESAQPYSALAALLMDMRDWPAALTAAEKGLQQAPLDLVLHRARAQAAYHLKQPAAEESATRVVEITRAPADRLVLAEILLSKQRLAGAADQATRTLAETKDRETRGRAHRILGEIATRRRDWPAARRHFEEAAEDLSADRDKLYLAAADAALRGKSVDTAARLAGRIRADSPSEREFKANVLAEQGRHKEAIEHYLYALRFLKTPENRSRILLAIGHTYTRWQKPLEAAGAFREAAGLGADSAWLPLARCLGRLGRTDEAIAAYQKHFQARLDPEARLELANLLDKRGDVVGAVVEADSALAALQGAARTTGLRHRAFLHLKRGDKQAARADLRAVHAVTGDPADAVSLARVELELGDPAAAVTLLESAAAARPDHETLAPLLAAYEATGRDKEALSVAQRLLGLLKPATPEAADALLAVAEFQQRQRGDRDAAKSFLTAYEWSGGRLAYALRGAIEALIRVEDWAAAAQANRRLIDEAGPWSKEEKVAAYRRQARLAGKLGAAEEVVRNLQLALDAGGEDAELHLALGAALFPLKRFDEAIAHYRAAVRLEPSTSALLGVARGYEGQRRIGLAIHYFEKALAGLPGDSAAAQERLKVLSGLGYLYFENRDYPAAARVWEESLALREDPSVRLRLARAYRLMNAPEEHARKIAVLDEVALPLADSVLYLEETAHRDYREGRVRAAVAALDKGQRLEPSDTRSFLIGGWILEDGRYGDALSYLEQAAGAQPDNAVFLAKLAYAHYRNGHVGKAIPLFEKVLQIDPDYLEIHSDLGYAYIRTADNRKAVASFQKAIDQTLLYRQWNQAEREQLEEKVFRLRSEVTKLKNTVDFTLYFGQSADDRPLDPVLAPLGVTALPSQSGAELAFQPPGIGFRNEHTLQIFSRILWGFERRSSFHIDRESYQAGLGLRYKPLRTQNLQLSAERLFGIGEKALDAWLLRGSHSWNSRDGMRVHQRWGNYTFLLNDLAYFVISPGTLTYYGEVRQGATYNIHNRFRISPHVIFLGRAYPVGRLDDAYAETGAGVSIQLRFRDKPYEAYRSTLEFLLQYRWGRRFLQQNINAPSRYDNLVFGVIKAF